MGTAFYSTGRGRRAERHTSHLTPFRSAGQHHWSSRQARRTVWAIAQPAVTPGGAQPAVTPGGQVAQILWFENYRHEDAPVLGCKNASLGALFSAGLPVPP